MSQYFSLSITGWSGSGYIILDPNTGSGAYKIGGGKNGEFSFVEYYLEVAPSFSKALFLSSAIAAIFAGPTMPLLAIVAVLLTFLTLIHTILLSIASVGYMVGQGCPVSLSTLAAFLFMATLTLPGKTKKMVQSMAMIVMGTFAKGISLELSKSCKKAFTPPTLP